MCFCLAYLHFVAIVASNNKVHCFLIVTVARARVENEMKVNIDTYDTTRSVRHSYEM